MKTFKIEIQDDIIEVKKYDDFMQKSVCTTYNKSKSELENVKQAINNYYASEIKSFIPQKDEHYWFICTDWDTIEILYGINYESPRDINNIARSNCFKTKQEAELVKKSMGEKLLKLKEYEKRLFAK